jgi:hypothetical protein
MTDPTEIELEPSQNTTPLHKDTFFHRHLIAEFISVLLVTAAISTIFSFYAGIPTIDTFQPIHHAQTDPTANWKTYTNAQYGFSFKYPNSWPDLKVASDSKFYKGYTDLLNFCLPIIQNIKSDPDSNCSDIYPGLAKAFYFAVFTDKQWADDQSMETNKSIFVAKNQKYVIGWGIGQDTVSSINPSNELMDQILSTFKFTDSGSTSLVIPPAGFNWQVPANKYFATGQVAYDNIQTTTLGGNLNFTGKEWFYASNNDDVVFPTAVTMSKDGWQSTQIVYNGFRLYPLDADGPGSSDWGYLKLNGNQLSTIIFSKSTNFNGPSSDSMLLSCPCTYEFRVFVSDPLNIDSVLPK